MKAMVLPRICLLSEQAQPLELRDLPLPEPGRGEIRLQVMVCGVCHTELDEIEGRTPPSQLPMVLGHQVVGTVEALGPDCRHLALGQRVGVAWIYSACGQCRFCCAGLENLCPDFRATGRDAPGGYAEYMVVPEAFAHPLPEAFSPAEVAPLLCAGAIGLRSLRLTGLQNGQSLGLTGFGASGHLVLQVARQLYPDSQILVFARNPEERAFALELGAAWAGDTAETPPEPLHAIIDTTPSWKAIVAALAALEPGGRLVLNAIRKESADHDYLSHLDYAQHLWQEKELKSVANITRADVAAFLDLAAELGLKPEYQLFPLEEANQALLELKTKRVRGAKVLQIDKRAYDTIFLHETYL